MINTININDYRAITSTMVPGQSLKTEHVDCSVSTSAAMKITYKPEGFSYKCFACGDYIFDRDECCLLAHRKALQAQAEEYQKMKRSGSIELPTDFSHTFPGPAIAWLTQGGWGPRLIKANGVGYSEKLGRVIFPLTSGWLGRAVHPGQTPKYWQVGGQEYVRFTGSSNGNRCALCTTQSEPLRQTIRHKEVRGPIRRVSECSTLYGKDCSFDGDAAAIRTVVIVEDILSAGRVGHFIPCDALLGTTTNAHRYDSYTTVLLWLDPDKAGQKGITKMIKALRWTTAFKVITSRADPKCLTNDGIKEILKEWL